jgi:hypothetical protein
MEAIHSVVQMHTNKWAVIDIHHISILTISNSLLLTYYVIHF